ncbi:MAG: hypothetical protein KA801_04330 [Syntrophorhabdaceae bacterium]|nr:hypothetical protein [Syntrophorhabdaceae bacterium]
MKTRAEILADAAHLRAEILEIFLDAEHWNNVHPDELSIDPDPDGELNAIVKAVDKMLARQSAEVLKHG